MFAFEFECDQQIYVFLFQTTFEETARDLMSHKGQKVHNYPLKFNIAATAIEYSKNDGNRAVERKLGVDRKEIREWRANKEEIISTAGKVKGPQ